MSRPGLATFQGVSRFGPWADGPHYQLNTTSRIKFERPRIPVPSRRLQKTDEKAVRGKSGVYIGMVSTTTR